MAEGDLPTGTDRDHQNRTNGQWVPTGSMMSSPLVRSMTPGFADSRAVRTSMTLRIALRRARVVNDNAHR
jgi:hypothetical protein